MTRYKYRVEQIVCCFDLMCAGNFGTDFRTHPLVGWGIAN